MTESAGQGPQSDQPKEEKRKSRQEEVFMPGRGSASERESHARKRARVGKRAHARKRALLHKQKPPQNKRKRK